MRLRVASFLVGLCCCGQPVVQGIFNGASYSGNVAPGTLVAIFGTSLAPSAVAAPGSPLPTQLNGVSVSFGGVLAPLVYVSPSQINAIIPFEVPVLTGNATTPVIVKTPMAASASFSVQLSKHAPGLFTQNQAGTGAALAFDGGFKPLSSVQSGSPIILYAVGLGPTNPPGSATSGGATSEPFNRVTDDLSVYVGESKAQVLFAGLAPGFPGIYQLDVVPNGPVSDRVYLQVGGWQSNIATLPMASGSNVANVTGTIDGLYPATGFYAKQYGGASTSGPIAFSAMLAEAIFSVSFDILPNAKPFSVVATSEAGSYVMSIDPGQGTYQTSLSVLTAAATQWNFFRSQFIVYDFTKCTPGCAPFLGNVIPLSLLDPIQVQALRLLPLSTTTSSGDGVNTTQVWPPGTLTSNHVEINNATFGGFMQIARPGTTPRSTTFNLYVDGTLVATKSVNYTVY